MNPITDHRRFYAEFITKSAGASDARLVNAFATVAREDFLGAGPWMIFAGGGYYLPTISDDPRLVYQDVLVALARERGINNGQPSLHARCLAMAAPAEGETVLHVGAGTGYYTAVLAELVGASGHVLAFEREADLAERATTSLRGWPQVQVQAASATDGVLPACDVIYANAGATHPPAAWLDALRVGGRLVLPLTPNEGIGVMLLITREAQNRWAANAFVRVAFIPCVGARDDAASASLSRALERYSLKEVRSLRRGTAPDATAWCVGEGWWLSTEEAVWTRSNLDMQIRPLGADDAAAFQALRQQGLVECPTAFAASPADEADTPLADIATRLAERSGSLIFGAFAADGLLHGVTALQREAMAKLAHKAWIWGVYVRPAARRSGCAEALMRAALDHAADVWRLRQVNLGVNTLNTAALALYQRLGFEVYGTERGFLLHDGVLYDEHHMVCLLNPNPKK